MIIKKNNTTDVFEKHFFKTVVQNNIKEYLNFLKQINNHA